MKQLSIALMTVGVAFAAWSCGGRTSDVKAPARTVDQKQAAVELGSGGASDAATITASRDAADCRRSTAMDEREYCCASPDKGVTFPHIQEAYCRVSCDDPGVFCIDAVGNPLLDSEPPRLVPGQQITVLVLGDPQAVADTTFVLNGSESDTAGRRRLEAAAASTPKPALPTHGGASGGGGAAQAGTGGAAGGSGGAAMGGAAGTGGTGVGGSSVLAASDTTSNGGTSGAAALQGATAGQLICEGSCERYRIVSYTLRAPDAARLVSVRLLVTSNANGTTLAERRIEFNIDRGRFRYELGFMVPLTFNGERRISAAPLSGTSLQTLEATNDAAWAFGVGIVIYPLGVHDTIGEDPRTVLRYIAPIGFGLGTNVYSSHSAFKEAFLTLNYRFGYGAVLGVGVTAAQGQFLRNNYAPGDILPAGVPLADVIDTRYMFRPNVTLTLSSDVLRGFINLIDQVNSTPSENKGSGR